MDGLDLSLPGGAGLGSRGLDDARLDEARRAAERGGADDAAAGFERLLATLLVREMRRALPEGFFGSGPGADTFEGWLDEHLGEAIAESRALGLSEAVRAQLVRAGADGAAQPGSGGEGGR